MSLRDELRDEDAMTRLLAAGKAARSRAEELFDFLLDLALHDEADVRTAGGMAEAWENVSDAAAAALGAILAGRDGIDPRVRAGVTDFAADDGRVAGGCTTRRPVSRRSTGC